MNKRVVAIQVLIFSIQWALMLIGFGLLKMAVAPTRLIPNNVPFEGIIDSIIKAGIALLMSAFWLYVWDRQVRILIYRREG
jgi:hypothetical protein